MKELFDFNKEYGLVLEGGGAKGAYQIGVWKAFLEYGVNIKGIAGVSVGALNGALMCMGDYKQAEQLWNHISYSKVMQVEDEWMDKLIKGGLFSLDFPQFAKEGVKFLLERGFDITPLQQLIREHVQEEKIKNSQMEFYIGTFSISKMKELDIKAKEVQEGMLSDYLLASAYFPAFKNERLHGKKYIDGGVVNNVPIDILLKQGYKDIIVVRIFGVGYEKKISVPEDVKLIEIAPIAPLGGLLEFDAKKSKKNIKIGYYDGLRCLKNLVGTLYYIESKRTEEDYLNKFLFLPEEVQITLLKWKKVELENSELYIRKLVEIILPAIAEMLKLEKTWTYQQLYVTILEYCAKMLRIRRYTIYTEESLIQAIEKNYKKKEIEKNKKQFIFDLLIQIVLTFDKEILDS